MFNTSNLMEMHDLNVLFVTSATAFTSKLILLVKSIVAEKSV